MNPNHQWLRLGHRWVTLSMSASGVTKPGFARLLVTKPGFARLLVRQQ